MKFFVTLLFFSAVAFGAADGAAELFMYNGTDTSGFGYPANGASMVFNFEKSVFEPIKRIPNKFNSEFLATSGAAVCNIGNGKKAYISIQTNGFVAAALVIADLGEGTTRLIQTPFLAHHVVCPPPTSATSSTGSEVYLIINDPFSPNETIRTMYQAVVYDFQKESIVRQMGSTQYSTAVADTLFSFAGDRTTAWMMQQSTSALSVNSGSVTVVGATSATTYALDGYVPMQVDGNTIDNSANTANGFAMTVDNDGNIVGVFYGQYGLSGSTCTFTVLASLSASLVNDMTNDGMPWWFCTKQNFVFAVGFPNPGEMDVVVTALKLPECKTQVQTRIPRGVGEERSIAGLTGLC